MGKKELTREDIIQAIRELEAEGIQPSRKALKQKGINGYWITKLIHEGLTALKRKLGIKLSPQEQPHSVDELPKKIDEVVSKLGHIPTWAELRRETKITDKVFLKWSGNNGIRGLFSNYRRWLPKHHPGSRNIRLVDAYLKGQDEPKTPKEMIIQPKQFLGVPDNLQRIYAETVEAFNKELMILCAIGLRSIIEGLCDDKKISSKRDRLEKKITSLTKLGIRGETADNLHGFRFMGNAAAHDLVAPEQEDLRLAIEIIEDLLNFVYELDIKARNLRSVQKPRGK